MDKAEERIIAKLYVIFAKNRDTSNRYVPNGRRNCWSWPLHPNRKKKKVHLLSQMELSLSLNQIMEALQPLLKGTISGAAVSTFSPPGKTSWLLDSGASFHMSPNVFLFF